MFNATNVKLNVAGSCRRAIETKLDNGAVLGMVLKSTGGGSKNEGEAEWVVDACSLVYGRYKDGTSAMDDREGDLVLGPDDKLIFIIRHGFSTWNRKKAEGTKMEIWGKDAPLSMKGYLDAMSLYAALNGVGKP